MTVAKDAPGAVLDTHLLVIVRELWNGDYLTFPIADPALTSYGSAEDAVHELRLFLQDHLGRVPPDVLARFTMPESTRLEKVLVQIPRDGLPRRLEVKSPIAFSCIIIPMQSDVWVIIPKIEHTFYVGKATGTRNLFDRDPTEELHETIRAEVKRIAAARELSTSDYLELLPARLESLESMTVSVERAERSPEGRTASLRRRIAERKKKISAVEILSSVALPLHERPEAIDAPELIGRDSELETLATMLSGKDRLSAVLIGPELVGKSALLFSWLRSEHRAQRARYVYATSGAQLIAGMSGLGQWQERLRRVMDAAETLDAILYFDNLADLFGDRATGFIDIAGAIKPYLQDGKVRLLGELTPESLDLFETHHVGFFSCLNRIRVEPLDAKKTARALADRIDFDTTHDKDRPNLAPEAVQTIIDLSERYTPYRPFPGKAMRFYEELRAICEKNKTPGGTPERIGTDRVLEAFSTQSGIPLFLLREDRALRAEGVIEEFKKRLIGQESAIQRVVETICVVKAQLQPAGKPLATFLFVGPTGVGKTELARTLAAFLFGSADRMVRFDMSEYVDPFAAERLIRGTDRTEGLLTKKIRQQPFCVLLLDEIEKAHPAVFDLLLQVCGEGRLTDTRGRTAYFHNTIIIMTSNLGAAHRRSTIGIGAASATSEDFYLKVVNKSFRPEFVNRLDRIITFQELTPEQVQQVARIAFGRIQTRRGFLEQGAGLELSEEALAILAEGGYSEAYGARALRRNLEDNLVAPVSRILGKTGGDARGGIVKVRAEGKELRYELERPRDARARRDQWGVGEIFELRRIAERWMQLERVQQLREHIAFVLSQLNYAPEGGAKSDRRSSAEITALQMEHHRLSAIWRKTENLHLDLLTAEELALTALFEGEDTREYHQEAKKSFQEFRKNLVYVLIAQEAARDQINVILQELDEGRAFDIWLVSLLKRAEAAGWTIEVSFRDDKNPPQGNWPTYRRFGPPRPASRALEILGDKERTEATVLLRAKGPYAGVLLALEAGLHRYIKVHPTVNPVHMIAHVVALRWELSDAEWLTPAVEPPQIDPQLDQTRQKAAREYNGTHEKLHVLGKQRTLQLPLAEYWQRFEEIALEHLLAHEEGEADRDRLFISRISDQATPP